MNSAEAADVVHWRDVYAELTSFLQQALARSPADAAHSDRLRRALTEMADRYSFWSDRGRELGGSPRDWSPN